jgi:general secretion pathway protein D/MSHA biogenesis protein MshL
MKPTLLLSTPKGFYMKLQKLMVQFSCLFFISIFLSSCVPDKTVTDVQLPDAPRPVPVQQVEKQYQLPVQFQKPSYMVSSINADNLDEIVEDITIKVGASISSTQGPQPLWDILKRLVALKKMSVSWASDVDQNVLVDVDINANDDFYDAIDNLLRQVDYYHEVNGSTIIVRYKETRQFHVAMPFSKSVYETAISGSVLESSIKLHSLGNEFNIWENIQKNLDTILDIWSTVPVNAAPDTPPEDSGVNVTQAPPAALAGADHNLTPTATRQMSASGNKYTIDKPIGLVTVHAPRPLLNKIEIYFNSLTKKIYKQISIEAKIIEVELSDSSSIGLDWNLLFKNLSVNANYSGSRSRDDTTSDTLSNVTGLLSDAVVGSSSELTKVIASAGSAAVSMAAFTMDTFINAVKEQGQTTILSNPRISVLNGQPAIITVGRNTTYIANTTETVSEGIVSTSNTTDEILSGVSMALIANILNNNEIILNLVPMTSQLQLPIKYESGTGLPIVDIRQMSTTVRIGDGDMLVIGGLISNAESNSGTFVPGTSNIPFFKYLFGYEEKVSRKRELIILLRPKII